MLYFICEEILDILMVRNWPQMSKSQASYANLIHTEISQYFFGNALANPPGISTSRSLSV